MRDEHQSEIGALIAHLRGQRGWSQRALAKWIGLDQSALSRIEAGRRRVTAEELQRIAHALGVSTDALLGSVAPAVEAGVPPGAPATPSREEGWRDLIPGLYANAMVSPMLEMDRQARPLPLPPPDDLEASAHLEVAHVDGYAQSLIDEELPSTPAELALDDASRRAADESEPETLAAGAPAMPRDMRPRAMMAPPSFAERRSFSRLPTPPAPLSPASWQGPAALPQEVAAVIADWFALRDLVGAGRFAATVSVGHSAEGKQAFAGPERRWGMADAPARDALYDRVARFWRAELHVEAEGPLPDLVTLLEDGLGVQVIVARVAADPRDGAGAAGGPARSSEKPVCAALTRDGVPFIFVNAARPVLLQRYALAHAFAHLVLGHGDIVDGRIEWSRKNPTEAAANDFAEELLAPVGAVVRWYERHGEPDPDTDTLVQLGNAFGISVWAALYRSRAAGRVRAKQSAALASHLRADELRLLPQQAFLGGLRDTLSALTPAEVRPPGESGPPEVLRLPATMRRRALRGLREGRLSLERAADLLRLERGAFAAELAALGIE